MSIELNTIVNCDCIGGVKLMADNSVDVCFTSPPYNRIRNDTYAHYDDTQDDYYSFLVQITDEMLRIAKRQVIVNVQMNHFNKKEICKYIGNYANNIKGIVIWEKSNPQPATNFRDNEYSITNAYEYFIVMGDDADEFRANDKIKNVITTPVNSEHFNGHGAVMRKDVCDFFIHNFTKEGDIVCDVFMGMGTTALSCYEQGRNYYGFELSEQYWKVACDRLAAAKAQTRLW